MRDRFLAYDVGRVVAKINSASRNAAWRASFCVAIRKITRRMAALRMNIWALLGSAIGLPWRLGVGMVAGAFGGRQQRMNSCSTGGVTSWLWAGNSIRHERGIGQVSRLCEQIVVTLGFVGSDLLVSRNKNGSVVRRACQRTIVRCGSAGGRYISRPFPPSLSLSSRAVSGSPRMDGTGERLWRVAGQINRLTRFACNDGGRHARAAPRIAPPHHLHCSTHA